MSDDPNNEYHEHSITLPDGSTLSLDGYYKVHHTYESSAKLVSCVIRHALDTVQVPMFKPQK